MGKLRTFLVWTLLIVVCVALYQLTTPGSADYHEFDVFLAHVANGEIREVRVDSNDVWVTLYSGYRYHTLGVIDDELTRALSQQGVVVELGEAESPLRTLLLVGIAVVGLLIAFLWFLKKMQAGGAGNVLEIRKSRARLLSESSEVSFADVGGCDEAKAALGDLVDFLRSPDRWSEAGVRLPRGVLLEGPPGCGKTLLARAVAGETDSRFYLVSASEFVEMFVGVGASRVRDMFETACKDPSAVIFIDELDAVGRRRGSGIGSGHDEREQTLNQLLVCMDGFETHQRVVVIAATNRADILDPALLRPGRFDRRIAIPPLDRAQRAEVLAIHARNKRLADDVSLDALAARTEGMSGADLESLVNEAGMLAVRRARADDAPVEVATADLESALRPAAERARFDRIDQLLIESTTQLAQPTGRAAVRLTLREGHVVEGELVWADAGLLKLRSEDGAETIVPKSQIKTIEPLGPTEGVGDDEVTPDRWAHHRPDLA